MTQLGVTGGHLMAAGFGLSTSISISQPNTFLQAHLVNGQIIERGSGYRD